MESMPIRLSNGMAKFYQALLLTARPRLRQMQINPTYDRGSRQRKPYFLHTWNRKKPLHPLKTGHESKFASGE
jgi:hypothetical protein